MGKGVKEENGVGEGVDDMLGDGIGEPVTMGDDGEGEGSGLLCKLASYHRPTGTTTLRTTMVTRITVVVFAKAEFDERNRIDSP